MPFTSEALIITRVSQDQLDAMKGTNSAELTIAIAETDARITSATGVTPESTATENHPVLSSIASRIVIWVLSGIVQGLSDSESARRRKDYEDALLDLEAVRSGELPLEASTSTTEPAVGCRARQMTEY